MTGARRAPKLDPAVDAVSAPAHADEAGKPVAPASAAQRTCLRCEVKFTSQWAGERICARCKTTSAWRGSVPRQFNPGRGGGR
jgi:hypothetical protein